ncbi:MAG: hypothetical protein K1X94_18285 [Sandaracinaceae bacterium]|nr:hypothetical protein [Sandaracinaceae bacterium]
MAPQSGWLMACSLLFSGCYASHERAIELDELREDAAHTPTLAQCRPRFPEPVVLSEGRASDGRDFDLLWTGRVFLAVFNSLDGGGWGAFATPDGHVTPLEGESPFATRLAVVPGTPFVAAGTSFGLSVLDSVGQPVDGPLLEGPEIGQWAFRSFPVVRPAGIAVLGSVWGFRADTPSGTPLPNGVFAPSGASAVDAPERMPTTPLVASDTNAQTLAVARDHDGFGAFAVAQDFEVLHVIDFDDAASPRVSATWPLRGEALSLHAAFALPSADRASFVRGTLGGALDLVWIDPRTGEEEVVAALGAESFAWTDVIELGERAVVAAPFAAAGRSSDPPLALRDYLPFGGGFTTELVVDPDASLREVRLARFPCGIAAAWRRSASGILLEAYDCCRP